MIPRELNLPKWVLYVLGILSGMLLYQAPPAVAWLTRTFMPHTHCYGSDPLIFWPWVIGDVLTMFAYVAIPYQLWQMQRMRLLSPTMASTFGAFILFCGVGHGLDALGQWVWPAYALRAYWGLGTAAASLITAYYLHTGAMEMVAGVEQAEQQRTSAEHRLAEVEMLGRELVADVDRADALREAVDHVPMFVIETNIQTNRIVWANKPLRDFLGRDPADMPVEEWFREIVTDDTRQRTLDYYAAYPDTDAPTPLTNRIHGTGGRVREVQWVTVPTHEGSSAAYARGMWSDG